MKITYLRIFAENALNFTACRFQKTKYLSLWKFKKRANSVYSCKNLFWSLWFSSVSEFTEQL